MELYLSTGATDQRQHVQLGNTVSATLTISTGSPQGCVLPPALLPAHQLLHLQPPVVKLIKFADDTTLNGLISYCDESP